MVAAAAIAASSALPPARSAATPEAEASRCGEATMPRGARDSGQRVEAVNTGAILHDHDGRVVYPRATTDAPGLALIENSGTPPRGPRRRDSSGTHVVRRTDRAPRVLPGRICRAAEVGGRADVRRSGGPLSVPAGSREQ